MCCALLLSQVPVIFFQLVDRPCVPALGVNDRFPDQHESLLGLQADPKSELPLLYNDVFLRDCSSISNLTIRQ